MLRADFRGFESTRTDPAPDGFRIALGPASGVGYGEHSSSLLQQLTDSPYGNRGTPWSRCGSRRIRLALITGAVAKSRLREHAEPRGPDPPLQAAPLDWINAVDPGPTSRVFTLAEINQFEHTVCLVEVNMRTNSQSRCNHHAEVFETELMGWYTDPKLWPPNRSLKMLH